MESPLEERRQYPSCPGLVTGTDLHDACFQVPRRTPRALPPACPTTHWIQCQQQWDHFRHFHGKDGRQLCYVCCLIYSGFHMYSGRDVLIEWLRHYVQWRAPPELELRLQYCKFQFFLRIFCCCCLIENNGTDEEQTPLHKEIPNVALHWCWLMPNLIIFKYHYTSTTRLAVNTKTAMHEWITINGCEWTVQHFYIGGRN